MRDTDRELLSKGMEGAGTSDDRISRPQGNKPILGRVLGNRLAFNEMLSLWQSACCRYT